MRRRFLFPVALALGLAVVVAPAVAGASGDRASGFGVRAPACAEDCPVGNFAFDARSGRHGQNPTGWFSIDFPGYGSFVGSVSCLNVQGKWASIFGQITSGQGEADPSNFPPSGTDPVYFVAVVHGKGAPRHGKPARDEMSYVGWDTEAGWLTVPGIALGDICDDPFAALGGGMFKLVAGNISVRDR